MAICWVSRPSVIAPLAPALRRPRPKMTGRCRASGSARLCPSGRLRTASPDYSQNVIDPDRDDGTQGRNRPGALQPKPHAIAEGRGKRPAETAALAILPRYGAAGAVRRRHEQDARYRRGHAADGQRRELLAGKARQKSCDDTVACRYRGHHGQGAVRQTLKQGGRGEEDEKARACGSRPCSRRCVGQDVAEAGLQKQPEADQHQGDGLAVEQGSHDANGPTGDGATKSVPP